MNDPAPPLLRSLSVAELLDATIQLYRKNFLTFVAIVAVIQVPLLILNGTLSVPMSQAAEEMLIVDPYSFDPEDFEPENLDPNAPLPLFPPGFGRYFLYLGLQLAVQATLGVVGGSLMTGALAWAVSERHLARQVSVGRAYRAVLHRWKPLLGATLLTLGIYVVVFLVGLVPCLGWLVAIPASLFAFVCLRFVPQAVMLEEQPAAASLRRSWYLTKPHFWRVLGIVALLALLGLLITAGPSYLVSYGVLALQASYVVRTLISTAVSAILSLLYVPIRLTGETLIYYDLRVRAEGLDLEIELDALVAETVPEAAEEILSLEPDTAPLSVASSAREPFLTSRDWRNLAILLGVGLGLFIVCCVLYFLLVTVIGILGMPLMEQMMEEIMTVTPVP